MCYPKKRCAFSKLTATSKWKNITLNEFVAPATTLKKTYVLHSPLKAVSAGESMPVKVQIVSLKQPEAARIRLMAQDKKPVDLKLEYTGGYHYSARIPAEFLKGDVVKYSILVRENGVENSYPSELENVKEGNYKQEKLFETRIQSKSSPLTLFSSEMDHEQLLRPYLKTSRLNPIPGMGTSELSIQPEKAEDYAMRYNFKNTIAGRTSDVLSKKKMVFHGRSLNDKPCAIQLALIGKDGSVYGTTLNVKPENNAYTVLLNDLKKVDFISLPRPYPGFLPYSLNTTPKAGRLDLMSIETLQIVIVPTQTTDQNKKQLAGISVQSVTLE